MMRKKYKYLWFHHYYQVNENNIIILIDAEKRCVRVKQQKTTAPVIVVGVDCEVILWKTEFNS